jgi:TRAP-type C4-dicarboxylate transport system substrate-binding protein
MFAWVGDPEQIALMKALGYQPVMLDVNDIMPGMQTGLINAIPSTAPWALAAQLDGAAPHMLDIRWVPIVGALIMTKSAFEGLSPVGRQALQAAAARAGEKLRKQRDALDQAAIDAMRKRGLQVHEPTPALTGEWQQFADQLRPKLRGAMVPADMFDAAQGALADYRKASPR